MRSLLITLYMTEYLIGNNQRLNSSYPVNININYVIMSGRGPLRHPITDQPKEQEEQPQIRMEDRSKL